MNIYIKIEVLAREIEGRMLLALAAAERGHDVLLGDLRALLAHPRWLPPGVFHDKSLTPSRSKTLLHRRLADSGFLVTSQDEEHGLLQKEYSQHAETRFSAETLGSATFAFMWGPHDAAGLERAFPQFADRIIASGSPRSDLWRPSSVGAYQVQRPTGIDTDRPLVLVAGHGYSPLSVNRYWDEIRNLRGNYIHGDDDPLEWSIIYAYAEGARKLAQFVRALRVAVIRRPDVQFIVRPHPSSASGAWESLVGEYPNLSVRRDGPVGPWIRWADLVVHDASTVGFEAAVAEVPLASFWPTDGEPELVSASLGRRFGSADELVGLVDRALATESAWFTDADRKLLRGRFGDLDGPLAVDRIVDAWESASTSALDSPVAAPALRSLLASGRQQLSQLRDSGRTGLRSTVFRTAHKFPVFDRSQIRGLVNRLRTEFERFDRVDVRFHGPRLLSVRSSM